MGHLACPLAPPLPTPQPPISSHHQAGLKLQSSQQTMSSLTDLHDCFLPLLATNQEVYTLQRALFTLFLYLLQEHERAASTHQHQLQQQSATTVDLRRALQTAHQQHQVSDCKVSSWYGQVKQNLQFQAKKRKSCHMCNSCPATAVPIGPSKGHKLELCFGKILLPDSPNLENTVTMQVQAAATKHSGAYFPNPTSKSHASCLCKKAHGKSAVPHDIQIVGV